MNRNYSELKWNYRNSLIITAPLVVVTIVYFIYVYLPVQTEIAELRRERDGIELLARESQQLGAKLESTQQELAAVQKFIDEQPRRLMPLETAMDELASIPMLARQAGASMERFEPATAITTDKSLARIPVNVECSGSLSELFAFLGSLEALPSKFWVDDLKLEAGREAGQKTKCELKLVVFAERSTKSD
ncbi:MAG: type 4a pilus biogenesis protein PilO [Pirellulales bacterium]|nr:type 4a pilus biogenesis protein PilO [Pirellulales bacterium]